jgi:hypothetical protein
MIIKSDMGYLLKFLLIALIVYYILRFFSRGFFSLFKAPDNVPSSKNTNRRPEGDVRVETNPSRRSHISKDEGEYVDFEEID